MSYESARGLGLMSLQSGGGLPTGGGTTSKTVNLLKNIQLLKTSGGSQGASLPPLRIGYERIPQAERVPYSIWYRHRYSLSRFSQARTTYPDWSAGQKSDVANFRDAKARVRAMLADGGQQVMRGSLASRRLNARAWWKRCDSQGAAAWAAWDHRIVPEVATDSIPAKIINHFVGLGGTKGCPSGVYRERLFKWSISDPGQTQTSGTHTTQIQSSKNADVVGKQATMQGAVADASLNKVKDLEEQIASLQSTIDSAQSAGASSAEVTGLQQQVGELTAALALAQQDHVAAAGAAASLHREEMSLLQMQIDQLVDAMMASQGTPAADNSAGVAEAAELQARVAALQAQLQAAADAAAAEEAAAAETTAASGNGFLAQHGTTLLIGGGVLLAIGAAYWYFKNRPAAALPPPTSAAAPAGLAANPMSHVESYTRKDGTKVHGHRRRHKSGTKSRRWTKAEMRRRGLRFDIYTGETL